MFGAIIGDMAGSIYEWNNIKTKDFPLFKKSCFPTDDSIMTIAVAKAILEADGKYEDLQDLAVKWMQKIGRQYPNCGYGGRFDKWMFSDDPEPYGSFGNGAAMRVSPCGWAGKSLEETRELSYAVTCVTHDHPEGIKGAEATACAIYLARTGSSKDGIREFIEDGYYKLDFTLDEIRPDYTFDVTCQGSVPQAIEAFLESDSFEDAIKSAVSIGGDSDTIAAITGSIAEAFYGVPELIKFDTIAQFDRGCRSHYEAYPDSEPGLIPVIDAFRDKYRTWENGQKHEITYVEPADYFPEEVRKRYKLGEYRDKGED